MKNPNKRRAPKLYSYVVDHDTGEAPNPFFGFCTLCLCKYRSSMKKSRNIVELAGTGDWLVGTGGIDLAKSAGHGKLIYAMRVTNKLTLGEYFRSPEFELKKPKPNGKKHWQYGDNLRPVGLFESSQRFVLISDHFYYFGRNAIPIPPKASPQLEKKGRGFKSGFDEAFIKRFAHWIERQSGFKPGRHGKPCKESEVVVAQTREHQSSCPRCDDQC